MARNNQLPKKQWVQNLRPYTGDVPSYVDDVERCAAKAGLTTQRMVSYPDTLDLFCFGTKEQIQNCLLLKSEEEIRWPKNDARPTRPKLVHALICRNYCDSVPAGKIYFLSKGRYSLHIQLDLPHSTTTLKGGIERHEFGHPEYHTHWRLFIGDSKELIRSGILKDERLINSEEQNQELYERIGRRPIVTAAIFRVSPDRWIYTEFPGKKETELSIWNTIQRREADTASKIAIQSSQVPIWRVHQARQDHAFQSFLGQIIGSD